MRRYLLAAALGAAACFAFPHDARANGRFPYANQLDVVPAHPDDILVRTTFGIIVSHDGGHHFNWICELIIGFINGDDPGIAIFDDGAQAVAGAKGLAITHDKECSYPFIGGDLDKQYVVDISTEKADPKRGLALTRTQKTDGSFYSQMFRSPDNGATWAKAGTPLRDDIDVTTIDAAPSDPNRIYVSGSTVEGDRRVGIMGMSADGGQTWQLSTVPNITTLYIAGIDPKDPLRVYARSYSPPNDVLFAATDGKTFKPIFTSKGSLSGFALSPDGSRIAVGGLQDGVHFANRMAKLEDTKFEQHTQQPVSCLTWTPDHLFVCGSAEETTFVLAQTSDEAYSLDTLVGHLTDIAGPPDHCPGNSPQNRQCFPDWCRQGNILCNPYRPVDPAGKLLGEAGVPAGCRLPSYCDAGTTPPPKPRATVDDSGCGLGVPGAPHVGIAALFSFLSLAVGTFIRRARRRR